jgi:Fe-S oxidoreductase
MQPVSKDKFTFRIQPGAIENSYKITFPSVVPREGYGVVLRFDGRIATKTIGGWSYYSKLKADNVQGKIDDCIECGACERACPQHLKIPKLLKEVRDNFEKND